MAQRRGLGRGLDALLGPGAGPAAPREDSDLRDIPVDLLQRGRYQPRDDMRPDTLDELAESIRAQGVIQPIVVRPLPAAGGSARYEIVAGERRWRAAQLAGLTEVPAVVRELTDEAAVAVALIENLQREDLNPLEEARGLVRLIREFDMTHQQVAEAVGRSRAAVSNLLRLLDLHAEVQAFVAARDLDMGHARALLALPEARQPEAARLVIKTGLSVRDTEKLVKRLLAGPGGSDTLPPPHDPDVQRLERDLSERLGAAVSIKSGRGKSGRLVISYHDNDELEGILAHIT